MAVAVAGAVAVAVAGGGGGSGGGGWFFKPNRLLRLCIGRVTVKTMKTSVHGMPHHAREKAYHRLMQLLAAEHLLHSVGRSVVRCIRYT